MTRADPWLFRRMVRLGVIPPTLPIYVFSDHASEQVAKLNGSVDQVRLAQVAPFPHDDFAVEMSCKCSPPQPNDQKMRSLTAVFLVTQEPFFDRIRRDIPNCTHLMMEVEALSGNTVIYPGMYSAGPSWALTPLNDEITLDIITKSNEGWRQILMRNPAIADKYNVQLLNTDDPQYSVAQYRERAGDAIAFLTSACAILASPAVDRVSGFSVGRAPGERKGQERRVETKWTHVDIDLDRSVAAGKTSDGDARSGVALHPVRAHLRVTKHGVSPVRSHMRGDAAFGVRHRVGHVHKSRGNA